MSRWGQFFSRRERMMEDLDQEIRDFIEHETQDNIARGLPPEEARYAALRKFGNVTQVKEETWEVWSFVWLEQLWQDLRHGLRMLAKNPGFTAVAVLTLALGIGANAAIFGLIDAMLLRPLPVSNPGQLVELWTVVPSRERGLFSYPMAREIARDAKIFSSVAPWSTPVVPLEVNGESVPGAVSQVTGDYFRTFSVRPALGRLFGPEDFKSGARAPGDLAVISYGFWQTRYGGHPDVLGKVLKVNGHPRTIVGVTPHGFFGPMVGVSIDVWTQMMPPATSEEALRSRQNQGFWLTARLQPGVRVAMARAEMETLWPQILQTTVPIQEKTEQRDQFLKQRIKVEAAVAGTPTTSLLDFERPLWVLLVSAGLLLVIACTNLASLLAARAANRVHEMGIRIALGATRWRITRQVVAEGVLLSMGGAAMALPIAYGASGMLARFVWTGFFAITLNLAPDWRILLFTGVVACLTGIMFSLLPAWQARRQDPASLMQRTARWSSRGDGAWKAGKVLIGAQVGLSLVLMTGASLFTRNLAGLRSLDLGFDPQKVVGMLVQPRPEGYKNFDGQIYYRNLIEELSRLPGVRSVSLSSSEPIWRVNVKWTVPVSSGTGANSPDTRIEADQHSVSPNYFATMGIRLLQGRDFSYQDNDHAPAVVIVSRSLAQRFFPGRNAVGQSITVISPTDTQSLQIIAVVNDANLFYVRNQKPTAFYLPFFQQANPMAPYIEIKSFGDPETVLESARRRVEASGREYIFVSETLTHAVNNSLAKDRVLALLSDLFGGMALLLVAIGLFGLMSYSVVGRTPEIGVRMALGAETNGILRLILSDSLRLIVIGMAVGLPAALGLSKLISKMLFNLSPADPISLTAALIIVVGVALLATYVPARRATKVDPMVALRYE